MSLLNILSVKDEQGNWHEIPALKGEKGETGISIESFVFSDDGTITVSLTDGTIESFSGLKTALTAMSSLMSEVEAAEIIRISHESTREGNEASRISAESSRVSAESGRVSAENARASQETTRQSKETQRQSAETARASAESARATAESGRTTAESGRVTAEAARVSAEEERAEEFATWEETIASKADAAEVEAQFTEQSQQIAALESSKADKAVEDARYKKQQTEIQFLLDAAKGQIAEVVTDDEEAYSKAVPSYTGGVAKFVDVKKLGGKSVAAIQIVDDPKYYNINTKWDSLRSSLSIVDGGYLKAACTENGYIGIDNRNNITPVADHVYFIFGKYKTNKPSTSARLSFNRAISTNYIVIVPSTIQEDTEYKFSVLKKSETNGTFIRIGTSGQVSVGDYIAIKDVYISDMTQWFGVTETTQVTDAMKAEVEAYIASHPDFVGNEIISADSDVVQSWSKNKMPYKNGDEFLEHCTYPENNWAMVVIEHLKPNTYYTASVYMLNGDLGGAQARFYIGSVLNVKDRFVDIATEGRHFISHATDDNGVICIFLNKNLINDAQRRANVTELQLEEGNSFTTFSPYGTLAQLNIPAGLRTAHPLRSAGTAYDEYDIVRMKMINRAPHIDLGSLNWTHSYNGNYFYAEYTSGLPFSDGGSNKFICAKYQYETGGKIYGGTTDKAITINSNYISAVNERIYIRDTDYEDPDAFKNSLDGVELIYQSTNPTEIDISSYFPADFGTYLPVEDGGSLTFHQTSTEFPIPNEEDFYYVLEGASA